MAVATSKAMKGAVSAAPKGKKTVTPAAKAAAKTAAKPAKAAKAAKPAPKAAAKRAPAKAAAKPAAGPKAARKRKPKIDPEQRQHYIEVAAYYIAERRGFLAGCETEDWAQAEHEIDELLRLGKLSV